MPKPLTKTSARKHARLEGERIAAQILANFSRSHLDALETMGEREYALWRSADLLLEGHSTDKAFIQWIESEGFTFEDAVETHQDKLFQASVAYPKEVIDSTSRTLRKALREMYPHRRNPLPYNVAAKNRDILHHLSAGTIDPFSGDVTDHARYLMGLRAMAVTPEERDDLNELVGEFNEVRQSAVMRARNILQQRWLTIAAGKANPKRKRRNTGRKGTTMKTGTKLSAHRRALRNESTPKSDPKRTKDYKEGYSAAEDWHIGYVQRMGMDGHNMTVYIPPARFAEEVSLDYGYGKGVDPKSLSANFRKGAKAYQKAAKAQDKAEGHVPPVEYL